MSARDRRFYAIAYATDRWSALKISAAVDTGRIGVILFFAISGFVIPSSLRAVGNQTASDLLRVFFIRRVFRLYPAYWVSVVAAALLGLFLMTPFSLQTMLLNLTMIQSVFGTPDVLGDSFFCWHDRALADGTQHFSRMVLVVFILFALGICAAPPLTWIFYAYLPSALASKLSVFVPPVSLGLGLFILLSTKLKLNHRISTWLGEISYSMYLFHPVVFYTLFVPLRDRHLPWLADAHLAVYLLLSVLGTIALSALIYYAVEKPMMRLGRRLSGTLFARSL
ncbi:MAG: hypothetical protein CK528_11895 [Alcaligenaceae bacterium]|nr:MAG: hypothetical protein CK528_11895 [Alcaligenaceae bacterium]